MAYFQDQVQTNFLNNANFANAVADRPYQQYGGPRIAGFNADQNQSFQNIRGLQDSYKPFLNTAQAANQGVLDATGSAQGISTGIGNFLNPYTSQVIDQSMQDLDRARLLQQQGINSQAASRGAFGGSRQAIAETENNRNFLDQQARTSAQLRAQGFDNAVTQFQNNNSQRLAAGGQMAQLGAVGQSLGLNAANALSASGLLQQQQVQRSYDLANQDFTNQFNYPLQQLAIRQSGINGGSNFLAGATPVTKGNSTATALGALGATSAVLKNLGISGSDVLNGVSSLFGSSAPSQAPSIGPQVSFGEQDFGNLFGSGSNNFGFNFLGGAQ